MSVGIFTLASLACGFAPSLPFLVASRVLQGIGGGGLASSEQSFLADTFPPSQRGKAFAAYGIVVVVGPTIGPTLGGWITDNISWHWIFLINVPVGIISLLLVQSLVVEPEVLERERTRRIKQGLRIDGIGFALVVLGLGCLEVFMDRGQREDWFASGFIVVMGLIALAALVMLIVWELNRRDPIVDLKLFRHLNFAICFSMMLLVGVVMFGSTQLIPQLLQEVLGYTATDAGLALTFGGVASLLAMGAAGMLSGKVQGRFLLAFGFVMQGLLAVLAHHVARGVLQVDDGVAQLAHPLDEVRGLVGARHVDGAVVADEAHRMALDVALRAQGCHAVAGLEFQQLRAVHQPRHHLAHVHGLAQVGRHQGQQVVCRQQRCGRAGSRGRVPPQLRHHIACQANRLTVVLGQVFAQARDGRVHLGAAQFFFRRNLARRRHEQRRPGQKGARAALHHDDHVRQARHVGAACGARAVLHGDDRNARRRQPREVAKQRAAVHKTFYT
eukprot:gene9520-12211_t